MPLIRKYVWLQVRKQSCKLTVWFQSVCLRQQTSHKRQNSHRVLSLGKRPCFLIVLSSMMLFKHSFGFTRSLFILYVHKPDRLDFGMLTVETAVFDCIYWFDSSRDRKGQSYPVEYYLELVEEYSKGKIHKSEPERGNENVNTVHFVHQARGNTPVCLRWTSTWLQMFTYIWASRLEQYIFVEKYTFTN